MLRLDTIRDPEMLRQVAVLLERENDTLHAKLQTLTAELARLRGDAAVTAQHELAFLKELLAQRERALFGPSSEQRPRPAAPAPPPAALPRAGTGPRPSHACRAWTSSMSSPRTTRRVRSAAARCAR